MPITKELFETAKDPSFLLLDFLEKNPNSAYSVKEIIKTIVIIETFGIPYKKIEDSLGRLVRNGQIEVAWLKGEAYYRVRD